MDFRIFDPWKFPASITVIVTVIPCNICFLGQNFFGRHDSLLVRALNSGMSGPGSSPGRVHCVVFLGKTLYSNGASLHLGV